MSWSTILGNWRSTSGAAVAYAEAGIPVLPLFRPMFDGRFVVCSCGNVDCGKNTGKHPIGFLVRHGVTDASVDPVQVRAWFRACINPNVGIALGPRAGAFALDVDPRNGGDASLAALERQEGALPPTVRARTGSGGQHVLFAWPEGVDRLGVGKVAPGIDVKGAGGYIVAAPSIHFSRERYTWTTPRTELAPAPAWLLGRLLPPPTPTPVSLSPMRTDTGDVHRRAVAYLATLPGAISGSAGHAACFRAAEVLVRGFALDPKTALDVLVAHYNVRCAPPWSLPELLHKIDSAARVGRMPVGALLAAEKGRAA